MTIDSEGLASTVVAGVAVRHWSPIRDGKVVSNFGDAMSPMLVGRLVQGRAAGSTRAPSELVAQGSVIHLAPPGATVWGAGINGKAALNDPVPLDIRAVRGPWTRRALAAHGYDVPRVYGDPACLTGRLFPELITFVRRDSIPVLCVPNLNDLAWMSEEANEFGVPCLDPHTEPLTALETIASAQLVIGSSLHAIIVAESLGIPGRFVRSRVESPFKYHDYLSATNRKYEAICTSLAEAVAARGMPEPQIDLDELEGAFPLDLWNGDEKSIDVLSLHAPSRDESVWLNSWTSPEGSSSASREAYCNTLARLSSRSGAPHSPDLIHLAVHQRVWEVPDLPADMLGDITHQALDTLVQRDALTATSGSLCTATSPSVFFYGSFTGAQGTIAFLTITDCAPLDPVVELHLVSERTTIARRRIPLSQSSSRGRLDVDIVLEGYFEIPTRLDAQVTLASGHTHSVAVEVRHAIPSYSPAAHTHGL